MARIALPSCRRLGGALRTLPLIGMVGVVGIAAGIWPADVAGQPAAGTPIVAYIETLRRGGLDVIYSDALLTAEMRVREEPSAGDALARLRSVLEPYGLALANGPRGAWLIVRAARSGVGKEIAEPALSVASPPPPIESIVVSASRYRFARSTAPSMHAMQQAELEDLPALGSDALRAARVLPGLTSDGLTARFHARGGAIDESSFFLDGVHLYNPYHLKDFQGLFSSISPRLLDSVEVRTGAFPADFGNRMSAVVDMQSATPAERRHYEVAANLFETSLLSSGRFADDRGAWLTSLRASNLGMVTGYGDSDVGEPRYNDFFSKLSFDLGSGVTLATGALLLNDEVSLRDSDEVSARADDRDRYVWVRLLDDRGGKLTASYLLTSTELDDRRRGSIADPDLTIGELHEQRRFVSRDLKADWAFRFSARRVLRWGAELEDMSARYEFLSHATFPAPIDVGALERPPSEVSAQPELSGQRQAAYLSYRFRPAVPVTVETGLRWDRQTYLDHATLSPRVNLLFDVGRATLRAAWGRFYQAQDPSELPVGDGVTTLYPTQESEHTVLGLEYPLGDAGTLRLEAYRKRLEHLRPRFENLYYRVSLLPELLPDRVMIAPQGGEASGIELAVDRERGSWSWWFALARSSVRDRFADGSSAPRSWDEPWSVKAGATWSGPRWTATVNATTHAGWPAAGLSLTPNGLVAEARSGERFPTFATLDVKATRRVELARGRLSWFLELDNAFDRANPCCLDYSVGFDQRGRPTALSTARKSWVPLVPSVGFMWEY